MAHLYPDAVVTDVLERSNIVDLVGSYIPLKRAGRNYKACCPFHPEKTPSFVVSLEKQIYHCFGCGVGGNAISFVMAYERSNFREALEILARRNGISLPQPAATPIQKARQDTRQLIFTANDKACAFYSDILMQAAQGQAARAYLKQRGITKDTAVAFRLGLAPDGWDHLIQKMKHAGVSLDHLEKAGLIVHKEKGGFYDRFRNRIIFPIYDLKGRTVAFGGRVMDESLPKYVNSPETDAYIKGRHLFGLSQARDAVRRLDEIIVVEGYLDMIMPFQAGVTNIVASLGTALTQDQIRLIKRFTQNVVMLYDPDLAGQLATLRALELLIQEECAVRIAQLPPGEDPDAFVRRNGTDALRALIQNALTLFDYKLSYLTHKFDPGTVPGKEKIVQEMLPTIKKFARATTQAEYLEVLSRRLELDLVALKEDFKRVPSDHASGDPITESTAIEHSRLGEIPITERMLVKLMLEDMAHIDRLHALIDPSDFMHEQMRKIVRFIFDFFCQGKACRPNVLMSSLNDDTSINIIAELAALDIHDTTDREKLIVDCVHRLKRDKILYQCREMQRRIEEAQHTGTHENLGTLIKEYDHLIRQRSRFHGETSN